MPTSLQSPALSPQPYRRALLLPMVISPAFTTLSPFHLPHLLCFWAVPLYLDSPIGHALLPHTPNMSLAALFPHRGTPRSLLPSSYTLYLAGAQIYCPRLLTSFAFLPESPSVYSGGPSGQTTHICDIFGRLFSPSSSQCMPGYRAL